MAQTPFIARSLPKLSINPHIVEILAFPRAQLLDIAGPAQVFAFANDLTPRDRPRPYTIKIVSNAAEIVTSSGLTIRSEIISSNAEQLGTLIVSGGSGVDEACRDWRLVDWIRDRAARASRIASVCSGAVLLAEAGLLDGRRAVTHWKRCQAFRERFPAVHLNPDPIFIRDGAVWTSAGVTAGIDLALAMVEEDHGRSLALAISRKLIVYLKRPGGQAQFSQALALQETDTSFNELHAWIVVNLDSNLSLARLADHAGMSLRSFSRHYRQKTGRTPRDGVEILRFEAARRYLEDGVSVTRTAAKSGFGSTETMRRVFLKNIGIGAQEYSQRFGKEAAR